MIKRNLKIAIRLAGLAIAVAQLTLLLYGCGVCKRGSMEKNLRGEWQVVQIGSMTISPQQGEMTFSLNFETNKAGGMAICNTYGGDFKLDKEGRFSIDEIFSTRVGCEGNRLEQMLLESLYDSKRIKFEGERLLFFSGDETTDSEPLLIMQRVK